MSSLAGKLLVASRHLSDPNFARSAVLMVEHGSEGALGLMLNRVTSKRICDVWQAIGDFTCDNQQPVNSGGPVPGPLIALHGWQELGEKQVLPGVFMSVQKDVLDQIVRTPGGNVRIYSGHSGWGGGQLEDELEAGGWITGPALASDVFDADVLEGFDASLWQAVLNRIGFSIMFPGTGPEDVPSGPIWN